MDLALRLPGATVSNLHAEIIEKDGALWVRDLDSTNGTYVNSTQIQGEAILQEGDFVQFASVIFRVHREAPEGISQTHHAETCDRGLALIQFDKLMSEQAVLPFFQPIVSFTDLEPIAYEVLGRSRLFGLNEPKEMFMTAALLNLEGELSRMFRWHGVEVSAAMPGQPHLFLNTHPVELTEPAVLDLSLRDLREAYRDVPITLEIHESSVTNPKTMRELRAELTDLKMGLAYDDFGAGQARLIELVEVPPDYLKFDMKLIRDIHEASSQRQQMLAALVHMAQDIGIATLAEGVELEEEGATCVQLGFEFAQGFYYGRPAPVSHYTAAE